MQTTVTDKLICLLWKIFDRFIVQNRACEGKFLSAIYLSNLTKFKEQFALLHNFRIFMHAQEVSSYFFFFCNFFHNLNYTKKTTAIHVGEIKYMEKKHETFRFLYSNKLLSH